MPVYVECANLKGDLLRQCVNYYEPIYTRNREAVLQCVQNEPPSQALECMKLYGERCATDPQPPPLVPTRNALRNLYDRYIRLICGII